MKPVEKVLGRLEGVRRSNGSWKALCPAHDDREPSLSVSEGDENKAILNCFAGCETENIVAGLGLEMKDLFERRNGHKKVLHSVPPKTTATVQPQELRRSQRLAGRVPTEAGSQGPEVPERAGGTHLVSWR